MGAVAVERELQLSLRGDGGSQGCTEVRVGLDHCMDSARMADMTLGHFLLSSSVVASHPPNTTAEGQ